MILNFIFSHLNAIVLAVWIAFLGVVTIRFFRPAWVKNISFLNLIFITIGLNIAYGLFVTWGQYHVWATSNNFTQSLLKLPLPKQVPFPVYLEWIRPLFENHLGYFLYYILGRVWFNIFFLFIISGSFFALFKFWKYYRGGFIEQGPELLLILMLISGLPGLFVSLAVGFIISILFFIFYYFKGGRIVNIEPTFIFATLFALLFTQIILGYL